MNTRKLKTICSEFRKGLIGDKSSRGMCGMASYALQGYLSFAGIETTIEEVDLGEMNHIYLRLADGRVIDVTGDQFNWYFPHKNYPKVYIGKPLDIHNTAT